MLHFPGPEGVPCSRLSGGSETILNPSFTSPFPGRIIPSAIFGRIWNHLSCNLTPCRPGSCRFLPVSQPDSLKQTLTYLTHIRKRQQAALSGRPVVICSSQLLSQLLPFIFENFPFRCEKKLIRNEKIFPCAKRKKEKVLEIQGLSIGAVDGT